LTNDYFYPFKSLLIKANISIGSYTDVVIDISLERKALF
jgi:hypothetical protein